MTPAQMARIHAAAFVNDRPWSADEFSDLIASKFVNAICVKGGFALIRVIIDEAELLTIAVDPAYQRQGIARALMAQWTSHAAGSGAVTAFLEVAADNTAARALYAGCHFVEVSRRSSYYQRKHAPSVDAIILRCDLTRGQAPQNPPQGLRIG